MKRLFLACLTLLLAQISGAESWKVLSVVSEFSANEKIVITIKVQNIQESEQKIVRSLYCGETNFGMAMSHLWPVGVTKAEALSSSPSHFLTYNSFCGQNPPADFSILPKQEVSFRVFDSVKMVGERLIISCNSLLGLQENGANEIAVIEVPKPKKKGQANVSNAGR